MGKSPFTFTYPLTALFVGLGNRSQVYEESLLAH